MHIFLGLIGFLYCRITLKRGTIIRHTIRTVGSNGIFKVLGFVLAQASGMVDSHCVPADDNTHHGPGPPTIRRLPTEMLIQIFAECLAAEKHVYEHSTAEDELHRLAKRDLLLLSQVSSRWHTIAMKTPKLWSRIFCDTSLWMEATAGILLSLLRSSLRRGGNHALTIEVSALQWESHQQAVLSLLCENSSRWREVTVWADHEGSRYMMGAVGKLHRLEALHVCADWRGKLFFYVAPRLKDFTFIGPLQGIPVIPWDQIQTFRYIGEAGMDPAAAFSLVEVNKGIRAFAFDFDFSTIHIHNVQWPSVSLDVETLQLHLAVSDADLIGHLFRSLILPRLRTIILVPRMGPTALVTFHWQGFLSLAQRSSFHNRLTGLELNAVITDSALLVCLGVLPRLNDLKIQDPTNCRHILITDKLLRGLFRKNRLIPRLRCLHVASRLQFTDNVYLELLSSRLPAVRDPPFDTHLRLLRDRWRNLSPQFLEQLSGLQCQGEFTMSVDSHP
ncbi:hypothetical protein C8R47DRAFT_1083535 [Mycena vitilis]|nr:hypothetical protein C8R47DRAFT_1083535 [Mycena vitilis]